MILGWISQDMGKKAEAASKKASNKTYPDLRRLAETIAQSMAYVCKKRIDCSSRSSYCPKKWLYML